MNYHNLNTCISLQPAHNNGNKNALEENVLLILHINNISVLSLAHFLYGVSPEKPEEKCEKKIICANDGMSDKQWLQIYNVYARSHWRLRYTHTHARALYIIVQS